MVKSCQSKLDNVDSGARLGSALSPVTVPPVHVGSFFHSGEEAIGCVDDSI